MKYLLLACSFFCFISCNWVKQKTNSTANKTGEVIAKTGSEFADGVSKGVEKTFTNEIVISDALKKQGVKAGKVLINSSDSATDNIVSAYLIFDNNIDQSITVKVFDKNDQEYGRVKQTLKGQKGDARFFDFAFDKRTNIDLKGKVVIE